MKRPLNSYPNIPSHRRTNTRPVVSISFELGIAARAAGSVLVISGSRDAPERFLAPDEP